MKIIEGLKKIKDLQRKAYDLRDKIKSYASILSFENPKYEDQSSKIASWIQSHHDILLEIEKLRERIAKTNLHTNITIEIGDNTITKSIHNWISRRRDLADLDLLCWQSLTDGGQKDQRIQKNTGEVVEIKVIRFYDMERKDKKIDELKSEKNLIDSKLEIINATTDLLD